MLVLHIQDPIQVHVHVHVLYTYSEGSYLYTICSVLNKLVGHSLCLIDSIVIINLVQVIAIAMYMYMYIGHLN